MRVPMVTRVNGMDNRRPQIAYGWGEKRAGEKMTDTAVLLDPKLSRSGCQISYAVLMLTPPSTAQVCPVT